MVTVAALCSLALGLGFGLPAVFGTLHFARTGEVWMFVGFPTYGGGPFERLGLPTSVPLLIGFVFVDAVTARQRSAADRPARSRVGQLRGRPGSAAEGPWWRFAISL